MKQFPKSNGIIVLAILQREDNRMPEKIYKVL